MTDNERKRARELASDLAGLEREERRTVALERVAAAFERIATALEGTKPIEQTRGAPRGSRT